MESRDLGRTLQILLKSELEGLSDGADDVLGQPITAFQDVTSCGSQRAMPVRDRPWSYPGSCPEALLGVRLVIPSEKGARRSVCFLAYALEALCLQLHPSITVRCVP